MLDHEKGFSNSKQKRLLRELAHIEAFGGEMAARLERQAGAEYFQLEGWRNYESGEGTKDIRWTIGKDAVLDLESSGDVRLNASGENTWRITLSDQGRRRIGRSS